jgi:hypothetical protein
MKKVVYVFVVFFLLFFVVNAEAQTTALQFSRVVTLAGNNITTSPYNIGTVPAGKVWKIEHMGGYRGGSSAASFVFYIDGVQTADIYNYGLTSYYYPNQYPKGVIWLKAGDEIRIINSNGTNTSNYFISVIEFSVVTTP